MYGPQGWWPIVNPKTLRCEYHLDAPRDRYDIFEISCGAILTQNTNWDPNVIKAIAQLKLGRSLSTEEYEAVNSGKGDWKTRKLTPSLILEEGALETLIRPAGYYNQKSQYLRNFARFFKSLKGSPGRAELLAVKGIGQETADSILLYAFGEPEFVVDAYTKRTANALGLIKSKDYSDVKRFFEENLPKEVEISGNSMDSLLNMPRGITGENLTPAHSLKENPYNDSLCGFFSFFDGMYFGESLLREN